MNADEPKLLIGLRRKSDGEPVTQMDAETKAKLLALGWREGGVNEEGFGNTPPELMADINRAAEIKLRALGWRVGGVNGEQAQEVGIASENLVGVQPHRFQLVFKLLNGLKGLCKLMLERFNRRGAHRGS